MAIPQIDPREISNVKVKIREKIDQLISCRDYIKDVDNNPICKAMEFQIDSIEQVAKDQLILPILRLLGYNTDYKDGHFDVWAEAKIALGKDNNKSIDYAIFCKNDQTHAPRLIIEAKALTKLHRPRPDYESPDKQIREYYQERRDSIYLSMVSNGEYFWMYKREKQNGNDKTLGKCEELFKFSLDDLKSNDEKLDLFVQLAAKCVIDKFAENQCCTEEYDEYIKNVRAGLTLRKLITEKLLNQAHIVTPDRFLKDYNSEPWQHKKIYKDIIITGDPDVESNRDEADKICKSINLPKPRKVQGKSKEKYDDELNKWYDELYNRVWYIYKELYDGLSETSERRDIGKDPGATNGTGTGATNGTGTDTTDGTKTGTMDGTSTTTTNVPSTDTTEKWKNDSKKGVFTQLERAVFDKVKNICGCESIFAVDNEQYITFVIAKEDQAYSHGTDLKRNRANKDDGTYDTPWFMQYGNIIEKSQDDPEHAQNDDTMRNACITLYRHGKSMKDLFSARDILGNTKLEKPAIRLKSLSDLDAEDIKDAIKECFDYWYDKWHDKPSN